MRCKSVKPTSISYQYLCGEHSTADSIVWPTPSQAWIDGFEAGKADRRIGVCSEYSSTSYAGESDYVRDYSRGYRAGHAQTQRDAVRPLGAGESC